jgi:hypothetical protein
MHIDRNRPPIDTVERLAQRPERSDQQRDPKYPPHHVNPPARRRASVQNPIAISVNRIPIVRSAASTSLGQSE